MKNSILKDIDLKKEKYIIVGTSAGPDSMALLHYLKNNTNNTIVCCHINHNVRKESQIEEQYLNNYCKNNNIIFESTKIDKYTENNFENEARNKRYDFYQKIINKYNAKYLFLAHHGDDLIETIIMKINRGSNLEGYAGIKKIAKKNNYYIIRPLLEYSKDDLINYNKKHNIKYYIDKSNSDTKYTRNRIRKNILPILKKENPNINKSILDYSETLQEYNNYISRIVTKSINKIVKNNTLDLTLFKKEDPFIQKNILYKILNDYYQNTPYNTTKKHINNILSIINSNKPNISINLPNNKLSIIDKTDKKDYKYKFDNIFIKDNFIIEKINNTEDNSNNICRLNSQNIKLPLYIRNKRSGDTIIIKGTNGKKKVKDIFIDSKIPKTKRDNYPLLVDSNDTIIWIPSIKKSKFNENINSFCDIILKYCEKEENDE